MVFFMPFQYVLPQEIIHTYPVLKSGERAELSRKKRCFMEEARHPLLIPWIFLNEQTQNIAQHAMTPGNDVHDVQDKHYIP